MADIAERAEALESKQREAALAAMRHARQEQLAQNSRSDCEKCGASIPVERQLAVPGVQLCIDCQLWQEQQKQHKRGRRA